MRRAFVRALSDYVASAAVGPVTAEPLREAGIHTVIPDRHRLGALVRLVSEVLTQRHVQRIRGEGVIIELRGRQVSVNDRRISLGPNSLALLIALDSSNSVLSRQDLIAVLVEAFVRQMAMGVDHGTGKSILRVTLRREPEHTPGPR